MEGVTVDGHHPDCRVTFGRGGLILFDKIPVPTIELPLRRSQTFLYISLHEKRIGKSHHPQNKTFIKGASPDVSGVACQQGTLTLPDTWFCSPILGLANAPIVETKFLELAMSLLDFSPRMPLLTFSILLVR